jgi:tetratricopeptide (TPR) repeat protein
LFVAHVGLVLKPAWRSAAAFADFSSALNSRSLDMREVELASREALADPLDSVAPRQIASELLSCAVQPALSDGVRIDLLHAALQNAQPAVARNPKSPLAWRTLARIHDALAAYWRQRGSQPEYLNELNQAIAAWEQSLQRYPSEPYDRLATAEDYQRRFDVTRAPRDAQKAIDHYTWAQLIDSKRPAETSTKMPLKLQDQIEQQVARLMAAQSAPASSQAVP